MWISQDLPKSTNLTAWSLVSIRAPIKHAMESKKQYMKPTKTILESTYMDDSMDSAPSDEECLELCFQLSKLWVSAGMHARKWLSNSERELENKETVPLKLI